MQLLAFFNLLMYFHAFMRVYQFLPPPPIKSVNTLRPRQNGRYFAEDIYKCIFLTENVWILINISLKLVPKGQINNIPALVQIMPWRRPGDKPLSEPMMLSLLTHICVTRPQWVKLWTYNELPGCVAKQQWGGVESHGIDDVSGAEDSDTPVSRHPSTPDGVTTRHWPPGLLPFTAVIHSHSTRVTVQISQGYLLWSQLLLWADSTNTTQCISMTWNRHNSMSVLSYPISITP